MATWKRWLRYAKAKLDAATRSAEEELDRREAELEAERAEKPWLGDDKPSPSYDDVKARIDAMGGERPVPPASGNPSFDLAAQERAAAERLRKMRESLGLEDDDPKA